MKGAKLAKTGKATTNPMGSLISLGIVLGAIAIARTITNRRSLYKCHEPTTLVVLVAKLARVAGH
jgi:hypothetical protein